MEKETEVTDSTPEPSKLRQFDWAMSPNGIFEAYCNYFGLNWTMTDVRVRCGQLVPNDGNTQKHVAQERCAVTFAWPQAKVIAAQLTALVASFESVNGEIPTLKLAPDPAATTKSL